MDASASWAACVGTYVFFGCLTWSATLFLPDHDGVATVWERHPAFGDETSKRCRYRCSITIVPPPRILCRWGFDVAQRVCQPPLWLVRLARLPAHVKNDIFKGSRLCPMDVVVAFSKWLIVWGAAHVSRQCMVWGGMESDPRCSDLLFLSQLHRPSFDDGKWDFWLGLQHLGVWCFRPFMKTFRITTKNSPIDSILFASYPRQKSLQIETPLLPLFSPWLFCKSNISLFVFLKQ